MLFAFKKYFKKKTLFSLGFFDYCVEKSDTLKMENILFYMHIHN